MQLFIEYLKEQYCRAEAVAAGDPPETPIRLSSDEQAVFRRLQELIDKNPPVQYMPAAPGFGIRMKDTTQVQMCSNAPAMASTIPESQAGLETSMRGEHVPQVFAGSKEVKPAS